MLCRKRVPRLLVDMLPLMGRKFLLPHPIGGGMPPSATLQHVCMFMCRYVCSCAMYICTCPIEVLVVRVQTPFCVYYCASQVSFREWQRQQRRLNPLSPPPPPTVSYIYTLLNVIHIKHLNFPGSLGFGHLFVVVSGGHDGAHSIPGFTGHAVGWG